MAIANTPIAKMIVEEAERVVKGVKEAINADRPVLQESLFVNHYLPILCAVNLKDEKGNIVPVDINHWLAIAKAHYQ